MPGEAVLHTLRHVWETLQPLGLPTALMGGLALAVFKHVRATRDVDLLVGIGQQDPAELCRILGAAGMRPRRTPPVTSLGRLDVIQLLYEPPETFMDLQIDLLLANSEYDRQALDRRIVVELPGLDLEVAVLRCEDLLLHKLLAGRMIDRADVVALLRANRDALDLAYLKDWADHLEVAGELAELWPEAFPDEAAGAK